MTATERRLIKLCSNLLADFTRATNELAAADRHLKVMFTGMHASGLTPTIIQTGFMPTMHLRAIGVYKALLRTLEEEATAQ